MREIFVFAFTKYTESYDTTQLAGLNYKSKCFHCFLRLGKYVQKW